MHRIRLSRKCRYTVYEAKRPGSGLFLGSSLGWSCACIARRVSHSTVGAQLCRELRDANMVHLVHHSDTIIVGPKATLCLNGLSPKGDQ